MAKTYRDYVPEQDLLLPPEPGGLAAGRSLGVFRLRRGGSTGSEGDRVGLRRGRSWSTSVSSADDDQDFDLRLLCWGVFVAAAAEGVGGGCGLWGVSGGERTGSPDDLGFSQAAFEGAARVI